ncbi:MAG: mannose-1-phosphate guanyltransferase [Armatimonadota bacterium]|nr:MAG: mannose-1-phosphate guanyltransferase [Armatimonadota bacterium]
MVQAVIMAGGEGARLRPLTCDLPKPMAPVANRPIMHHIVALLRRLGVEQAFATLHYLADEVETYFGAEESAKAGHRLPDGAELGLRLEYAVEDVPLGTAGSVRRLMDRLEGTFLIISGDALTDLNLRPAIDFHKRSRALATLVLTRVVDPLEYGVVITDERGRVERFLEKPSAGELFSDTVNTGIYILEPEVLARVDPKRPVDFSKDLYPVLLAEGRLLCGYVAEGYWTDIGNLDQYLTANHDCLRGEVTVDLPGEQIREAVWVGENTLVHPAARVEPPVLIGHGCSVGPGAQVGPLSVVGDNCVIESGAAVEHSVVWSGTYIGQGTRIKGATICRHVVAKRNVTVNEGAVVGDRCLLEEGTAVMPRIRIWPNKVTEHGSKVTMSLIWGTKWPGALFGASGVTGLANVEITPEFAARLGAAFGAYLESGAQVITSRDSHHVSRLTKRAMIAGLMSVGANVLDLRIMPGAVARHMANISGAGGGVHVAVSPTDPTQILIEFFDGTGKNLDRAADRKIETIFFREDFRRAPLEGVGSLEFLGRTVEYYTEDFLNFVDADAIGRRKPKLLIDYAYGPLCLLMPLVLGRLGCEATSLNAFVDPTRAHEAWASREQQMGEMREVVRALRADMGLLMGSQGERFAAMDEEGEALVGDDLLLAFIELVLQDGGAGTRIAVPFSATSGVEEICERHGAVCVRTKADARSLMEAAGSDPALAFAADTEGGFIFPQFLPAFDAMLALGKLVELLSLTGQSLGEVRARLPQYFRARVQVRCPWEHKGTIMRRLYEENQAAPVEQLDGIKIQLDSGWVVVLPDVSAPLFHVRAESRERERVEGLVAQYAARIEELQGGL